MTSVDVAVSTGSLLGECPLWSHLENVLYWIDIESRTVHRYDPSTGDDEVKRLPGRPGSIALTHSASVLLVAMEHELVWFDWTSGRSTTFVAVEEANNGNRLNDGRTDPAGRFVVGSMWARTRDRKYTGSLYSVDGDATVTKVRSTVGVANGLAFDPARGSAYFADTFTEKVIRWDYDPATGTRTNERLFFDYQDLNGLPDGACVDAAGCYWSSSVYGWAIVRITPDGLLDRRIELPVEKPTMPAFGGADLTTLYVTSIGKGEGPPRDRAHSGVVPGSLLAIDAGVQGVAEPVFSRPPLPN